MPLGNSLDEGSFVVSTVVALAIVVMDEQDAAPSRPELRVVVNTAAQRTAEALAEALASYDETHPPEVRL